MQAGTTLSLDQGLLDEPDGGLAVAERAMNDRAPLSVESEQPFLLSGTERVREGAGPGRIAA